MSVESTPTWLIGPEIPPPARIGTVLAGTYRLDAFLGQGLTGVTYNAWHLRQKAPFAVKLLRRSLQPSHERVLRLRSDLRALADLGPLGFLPVDVSFAPDGAPFLAAELLVGETLRQRLQRGALPAPVAGAVIAAVGRALHAAHQAGVVHGDLRPENIFLTTVPGRQVAAGQPVLLDMALHHLRRRPIGLDEDLPLGKLAYLAPEQASGELGTADVSGDVFALGAILFECITGQQAFGGEELEAVLEKLGAPPRRLQTPPELTAPAELLMALDVVIAGACARQPEARIPTVERLLAAINQCYAGAGLPLPVLAKTADSDDAGVRSARRRTLAQKRVVPLRPSTIPGVDGPKRSGQILGAPPPIPQDAPKRSGPVEAPAAPAQSGPVPAMPRPTLRARDLSRLLADVQAGRLTPSQAVALAGAGEERLDLPTRSSTPPGGEPAAAAASTEAEKDPGCPEASRAEAARREAELAERFRQVSQEAEVARRRMEEAEQARIEAERVEAERADLLRQQTERSATAKRQAEEASPAERGEAELDVAAAEAARVNATAKFADAAAAAERARAQERQRHEELERALQALEKAEVQLSRESEWAAQAMQQLETLRPATAGNGAQAAAAQAAPASEEQRSQLGPSHRPAQLLPVVHAPAAPAEEPEPDSEPASTLATMLEATPIVAAPKGTGSQPVEVLPPPPLDPDPSWLGPAPTPPREPAGITLRQVVAVVGVTAVLAGATGAAVVLLVTRSQAPAAPPPPAAAAVVQDLQQPSLPAQQTTLVALHGAPPAPTGATAADSAQPPAVDATAPAAIDAAAPAALLDPARLARRKNPAIPPLRTLADLPIGTPPTPAPAARPAPGPDSPAVPAKPAPQPDVLDGELRDPYQ